MRKALLQHILGTPFVVSYQVYDNQHIMRTPRLVKHILGQKSHLQTFNDNMGTGKIEAHFETKSTNTLLINRMGTPPRLMVFPLSLLAIHKKYYWISNNNHKDSFNLN